MSQSCFAASALCWLWFLHPYLISLRALRTVQPAFGTAPPPLSATLVFAAYNEQAALVQKIANLRAIRRVHPDMEIIAYSDGSSDDTVALLSDAADMIRLIQGTERAGKAAGMRRLVRAARGDIVIFTDANVLVDPATIAPLLDHFTDPAVGGVAGSLRYVNDDAGATARAGGLYWRLEERIKAQESRVGSIMGADGSIFALRRALYPEVPPDLLDDMIASLSVTFAGYRLIHSSRVVAYEKSAVSAADEFRRKRRIACRAFNTHRYLWPQMVARYSALDLYKYISHKLLRWLGLVPLLLAAILLGVGLLLSGHSQALLAMLVALLVFLIAGSAGLPGFGTAWQVLAAITATFLGVTDALRGRTMRVWTPAASRN